MCLLLVRMADHDINIAAAEFPASVSTNDAGYKAWVDTLSVAQNGVADMLNFGARNLAKKFVEVFDTDLLHSREILPSVLDHIIQIPPSWRA